MQLKAISYEDNQRSLVQEMGPQQGAIEVVVEAQLAIVGQDLLEKFSSQHHHVWHQHVDLLVIQYIYYNPKHGKMAFTIVFRHCVW